MLAFIRKDSGEEPSRKRRALSASRRRFHNRLEDRHGNAKRQEISIVVVVVREIRREQAVVLPWEVGVREEVFGAEVVGTEVFFGAIAKEQRRQAQPGSFV